MRTTKSLRIIALLMVLCMTSSIFFACKENPDDSTDTTDATSVTEDPGNDELTNTDIVKQLYGDKKYNGNDFRIVGYEAGTHWYQFVSADFNEIWFENDSSDTLSSQIYTRNRRTEDLLDINIVPIYWDYDNVIAVMNAHDDEYDAFAIALSNTYEDLASSNFLYNFYNVDGIDMTHDWWDQELVNNFTMFGNKLYAMSGDAFVWDDYATSLFMFNRDVIDTYGLENPYDLVREGTWTFDKLLELGHTITRDKNNDGHMDELDAWGSSCLFGALYHLIYGCDITVTVNDYAGTPMLNIDSDEMINRVSYLFNDVLRSGDMWLEGYTDDAIDMLARGDMLFYHTLVSHIHRFRDYDFNYGVLPLPKYDEAQTRYTSEVNPAWYTCYSIPNTVTDLDYVSTVLETLSGFSTDTVDNAIYNTLLGYDSQLITDDDSVEMLKIVFDGKLFDWSGFSAAGQAKDIFLSQTTQTSFKYVSEVDAMYDAVEGTLNEFIAVFEELD